MRILMLGNGFDLYHKLPTTYRCFLLTAHYLSTVDEIPESISSVFSKIRSESKEIDISYSEYKRFYNSNPFGNDDKKQLSELKSLIDNNIWFNYFWANYNKESGWIDFEKEISKMLLIFSKLLESELLYNQPKDRIHYHTENLLIRQFDIFFSEETTYENLYFKNEYLIKSMSGANKFSVDKKKVYTVLHNSLIELAEALKLYLNVFIEKPLQKMSNQNIIKTNRLFAGYDNVVTFNYTNTYRFLYGNSFIYHIHGNLDTNIVLGINPDKSDELPKLDTSYIMFKKYYQRVFYQTDDSFINLINSIEVAEKDQMWQQNTLTVCGHSLDYTDQDVIKVLFGVSDSIMVVYHDLSNVGKYITNLVHIYGKSEFDEIRSRKNLRFITYEEWAEQESLDKLLNLTTR